MMLVRYLYLVSSQNLENMLLFLMLLCELEDHSYYALIFPTANKGWLYDLTTSDKLGYPMWYEWNAIDAQGNLIRPRANCAMFFNGLNLVGDYSNGNILAFSCRYEY